MTPMIDVVFLLLIFFVCASLGREPEAQLPTTLAGGVIEAADPDEPPPPLGEVWVELSRRDDETLATVNERQQSLDELEETLRGLANVAPEIPVILDAADDVPVGDVIRVFDTARAAGFEAIRFATEPQRSP